LHRSYLKVPWSGSSHRINNLKNLKEQILKRLRRRLHRQPHQLRNSDLRTTHTITQPPAWYHSESQQTGPHKQYSYSIAARWRGDHCSYERGRELYPAAFHTELFWPWRDYYDRVYSSVIHHFRFMRGVVGFSPAKMRQDLTGGSPCPCTATFPS
jgi:hypothetical protein